MLVLDKDTFEAEVLSVQGLVLVDYWSESCEPCKALMPEVEAMSHEFEGKVKFCKLDVTSARRLAIGQKILGLPTISLYKDGSKVDEVTKDDANAEKIRTMLENALR